jgi:hypothetical protein
LIWSQKVVDSNDWLKDRIKWQCPVSKWHLQQIE